MKLFLKGYIKKWLIKSQDSKMMTNDSVDATKAMIQLLQKYTPQEIKKPFIQNIDLIQKHLICGVDLNAKVVFGQESYTLAEVLFYRQEKNGFGQYCSNSPQDISSSFLFLYLDSIPNLKMRDEKAIEAWLALVPVEHNYKSDPIKKNKVSDGLKLFERLMLYMIDPFPALFEKIQKSPSDVQAVFIKHVEEQLQKKEWCKERIHEFFDITLSQRSLSEQQFWMNKKETLNISNAWPLTEKAFLNNALQLSTKSKDFAKHRL